MKLQRTKIKCCYFLKGKQKTEIVLQFQAWKTHMKKSWWTASTALKSFIVNFQWGIIVLFITKKYVSLKLWALFDFHVLLALSGTEALKLIVMRHLQTLWLQQAIPVWRWLAQEASKSIPTGSKYHALTKGNKNQLWRGLPCSWHCCAGHAKWLLWRQTRAAPFKEWRTDAEGSAG